MVNFTITLDRIREQSIRKGMNQTQLARAVGLERSAVSSWFTGRSESYKKMLPKIAEALDVSVGYLLGEEEDALPAGVMPLPETKKVPLLGTIACGEPILAVENISDFLSAPLNIHCDFALSCKGDSMVNARIFDGDVVFIRQQEMVENGEIAAVLIDNEATLKRFYRSESGTVTLCACNPMFPDMVFVGEQAKDIRVLGKAVAFTSWVR